MIVFFSSCQKVTVRTESNRRPNLNDPTSPFPQPTQLTFIGENENPTVSGDGSHIYYLSYLRRRHKNRQVYRLNLSTGLHKRITYHDGENYEVITNSIGNTLFYTSTTDEIKEDSTYIRNALKKMVPEVAEDPDLIESNSPFLKQVTEIYQSQRNGGRIVRLTKTPKFDGHISLSPKNTYLLFSSQRSGRPQIYRRNLKSNKERKLIQSKNHLIFPSYSPSGLQIVYVEVDFKKKTSMIRLADAQGKKSQTLLQLNGVQRALTWTPDGEFIVFSSNRSEPENFEIYALHRSGACLKRLTYHIGIDDDPAFGRDGKTIYFTSDRNGKRQVYQRNFTLPESCINI